MAINKHESHCSGYATKANLKCGDGRTILKDAFKHMDGKTVPLVWQHLHNEPTNVLGHALLENREDGVYAYCVFNSTPHGQTAKELVEHGDVNALSIYANNLKQNGPNVTHGQIREVSLVLSGANPGALIDNISFAHSDGSIDDESEEAIIYTGEEFTHAEHDPADEMGEGIKHTTNLSVQDIVDGMTEEQKNVLYVLVAEALTTGDELEQSATHSNLEGEDDMKNNIFDNANNENLNDTTLSHSELAAIVADGKKHGSLREAFIAHGIEDIEFLFPDMQPTSKIPISINRDQSWVKKVMNSVGRTPFSRVKSLFADLTEDEARAMGYIKGKKKKEEVFGLLKRTTTPQTIYKKQKLERDDVIDIVDFDVVAWLKAEMRMMLDEEIARAILISDGRLTSSDDKIQEANIRPVWKDDDLFTIKKAIISDGSSTGATIAKDFIVGAIKSRKDYKGSGEPTLYTTEDMLTDLLLLEDTTGRTIYDSVEKLRTTLRVKEIVTVPVMENQTRVDTEGKTRTLLGLIVNLADYNVGADKGGAINMFDDFDIDYNAQKYLIETRCSGAMIKPYAAIAIELIDSTAPITP